MARTPKKLDNKEWGATKNPTVKNLHAFEQLDAIEKAKGEQKVALLKEYGGKAPLNFLLSLNFRSDIRLDLPEGMPPLEANELDQATHPDMMGNLASNVHLLQYCLPGNNLKAFKKEEKFIQVLLSCPLKDAEIVCFAKDKALEELYPSITSDFVKSVYPVYVA